MQSMLINLLATVFSTMSLPMNHRVGAAIGWLAWQSRTNLRTITLINLSLCFPDWSEEKKQHVGKSSLMETGKALTESFWLWKRPASDIEKRLVVVNGEHLLREAQASPRGLIVATPHMGSWETCSLPLVAEEPMTYFYKPPRMSAIEPLMVSGRNKMGAVGNKLDSAGIKHVLKKLKQGSTIGILPDQEPDLANGQFAPFFSQPANTMTLLAKFANKTNAQVLFCYAKRLPKGAGWQLHYLPAENNIGHSDKAIAARALNASVERCVLECPEQYIWNYKRFRLHPDGSRRNYKSYP